MTQIVPPTLTPLPVERFWGFCWRDLVAGIIFASIGTIFALQPEAGLIFFLFALPPFVWTGAFPLVLGVVLLLKAGMQFHEVTLFNGENMITLQCRGIRSWKIVFSRAEVEYIGLRYCKGRGLKWVALFIILLIAIYVDFKYGISLLGQISLAPLLVACGFLSCIGIGILVFPRRVFEIAVQNRVYSFTAPGNYEQHLPKLCHIFNLNEDSIHSKARSSVPQESTFLSNKDFAVGAIFLVMGLFSLLEPDYFFGQFTPTICFLLGARMLAEGFRGTRSYGRDSDKMTLFGLTHNYSVLWSTQQEFEPMGSYSLKKLDLMEVISYVYLQIQAIQFGFRFVWWGYANFDGVDFVFAIGILIIVAFQWFQFQIFYQIPLGTRFFQVNVVSIDPSLKSGIKKDRKFSGSQLSSYILLWIGALIIAILSGFYSFM